MSNATCKLCPRQCCVDRSKMRGVCGESNEVRLARAALHHWEEPPISGESGSGTVFFTGCPLGCAYCQNGSIARGDVGKVVSIERLARIFLELQEAGALNINLVTPTHFIQQICTAIDISKSHDFSCDPLHLPIVYNTSGYETTDALSMLDGYVDVFLTDFKYVSSDIAAKYSKAADYPYVASDALDAMYDLVGPLRYGMSERGEEILRKGVIVRHLLLPGNLDDSKRVMDMLASKPYKDDIIVSIMNQYTPQSGISRDFPELAAPVDEDDYDELIDYALELGFSNSFMQEGETSLESFIPAFDFEGV